MKVCVERKPDRRDAFVKDIYLVLEPRVFKQDLLAMISSCIFPLKTKTTFTSGKTSGLPLFTIRFHSSRHRVRTEQLGKHIIFLHRAVLDIEAYCSLNGSRVKIIFHPNFNHEIN